MIQNRTMFNLGPKKHHLTSFFSICLAVSFVIAMVIHPKIVYDGAVSGLEAWWKIVFPSLLPFFIASEILMKLGLVRFMGVLLEPIMRPLFNVPGAGAFVMVIGFTSGFPIGSMVTAKLREQGLCSRIEAERLMSFTNNSSPLFMLTAVAVGMFGRPDLGIVIAGSHYLANLLLGLLLRFYGRNQLDYSNPPPPSTWSVKQAFKALLYENQQKKQSLGQLMGDAVASSITKLLNIGGFIILFAVIIHLLQYAGIIDFLVSILGLVLIPLGFSQEILTALASGLFEMTTGTKLASEAPASELQRLMTVAMILGWSGLCIHAQVASMIAKTDIRIGIFFFVRIAHAGLAAILTWLFYKPEGLTTSVALPVVAPLTNLCSYSPFTLITVSFTAMLCLLLFLILLGLICQVFIKTINFFTN